MPLIHDKDDIANIFEEEELCRVGMGLFLATGHTFRNDVLIKNKNIKDFVYFNIQHSQVLTTADWDALNKVKLISLLFTNDTNYFGVNNHTNSIDYFSISLCTTQIDRSTSAYAVHQVLSRLSPSKYSVVLFETNGYYMLSFAERLQNQINNKIVLSDWHTKRSIIDKELFLNINAAYFSSNSEREFFYDFEYAVARPYYIYPISREYAYYGMLPINLLEDNCLDFIDKETINEINRANYLLPMREYQNDYVNNEEDIGGMQEFSTDDIALDLLELEIGVLQLNDDDDEYDDEYSDSNASDHNEIDKEIYNDPLLLLKWIEKRSFEKK